MSKRLTVAQYFERAERLRPHELVRGMLREPPAPKYGHQAAVTRGTVLLDEHVRAERLGVVCVAPIDVVLDEDAALVLQPDVVFVAAARTGIIRDRIWGPPDLVVEVTSPATAHRDRSAKMNWYARYGVRECWLVAPERRVVEVFDLASGPDRRRRVFTGRNRIRSTVLPRFEAAADEFFA